MPLHIYLGPITAIICVKVLQNGVIECKVYVHLKKIPIALFQIVSISGPIPHPHCICFHNSVVSLYFFFFFLMNFSIILQSIIWPCF